MLTEFDPVKLSLEENQFLIDTLHLPAIVALQSRPPHVTLAAIKPIFDGVAELTDLEKHEGATWAGIEAIKVAARTYIEQARKWEAGSKKRGAPRYPSMCSFDSKGRAHLSGVGSDSGQVRTYFDKDGERVPFAISLIAEDRSEWRPEWLTTIPVQPARPLVTNDDLHRVECFCGHTESFREGSRASLAAARARMSKHLRRDTDPRFTTEHRELHTLEFA